MVFRANFGSSVGEGLGFGALEFKAYQDSPTTRNTAPVYFVFWGLETLFVLYFAGGSS